MRPTMQTIPLMYFIIGFQGSRSKQPTTHWNLEENNQFLSKKIMTVAAYKSQTDDALNQSTQRVPVGHCVLILGKKWCIVLRLWTQPLNLWVQVHFTAEPQAIYQNTTIYSQLHITAAHI